MFKTDILFTGSYGFQNTGDDAFVEVAAWGAKNIWDKDKVRFLAKGNNLPLTQIVTKAYPFNIPKTFSIQKNLLLKNTQYLISAGGSTIHSKMGPSNPKVQALQLKTKGSKIKIGAIGVSIGPFKSVSDEQAVIQYLKSIDFLALRDQASYDYASSLNLDYRPVNSFDLAALLPEIYDFPTVNIRCRSKKVIGISVCPVESLQQGMPLTKEIDRNEKMIDLIKELDKHDDIHFKFYVINGNKNIGDYRLTQQTIQKSSPRSHEIVNYNTNTSEVWKSISECDFVISTRLHAAIFACFSSTPFILNEYHRKCSDFLQNVDYHEPYRIFNSEYNVKEKAYQIIDIINTPNGFNTPSKVLEMKGLARLNFTAIKL